MYCGCKVRRGHMKNNKAARQFLQAEALMFWQHTGWKVKEKVVKRKRGEKLKILVRSFGLQQNEMFWL